MNGTELKVARIKAGLKQYELAQLLGIPQTRVSEFENNRRTPPAEILERLLHIFEQTHRMATSAAEEPHS